jgi:hypothetical protein
MFYVWFVRCYSRKSKIKKAEGKTALGVAPFADVESTQDAYRNSPNFVYVNSEFDMWPH